MTDPRNSNAFGPDPQVVFGEYEHLSEQVKVDPDAVWSRLIEISLTTDDASLYWVADIVEDLVVADGERFVPRIEAEARANPRFRRALIDMVPMARTDVLDDRLLAVREAAEIEFGVSNGSDAPSQ
jgi:hypothetical protein